MIYPTPKSGRDWLFWYCLVIIPPLPTLEFWIVTHPEGLIYNSLQPCLNGESGFVAFQKELRPPQHSKPDTMEKMQFVYAELKGGISLSMLEDPLVAILSEGTVFMVTTLENSRKYNEDFYPVCAEAQEAYGIRVEDGRLYISN